MTTNFEILGPSHLVVLALTLTLAIGIHVMGRRVPQQRYRQACKFILVATLAGVYAGLLIYKHQSGGLSLKYDLPMQLCDWAAAAVVVAILTRNQSAFEMAYFWGLSGTLQGLVTPVVSTDFPDPYFILFFIHHAIIVLSIVYLVFVLKLRPFGKSILRVFLWSQVYLVLTLLLNVLIDANYGFLMHKPQNPSMLDWLGPWPYYILSLELVAVISYLVYYLPFFVGDQRRSG